MSAAQTRDEPFTTADAATAATTFTCLLCGGAFTHAERVCAVCPLSTGCDVVACPRCGYAFPRTSRVVETLREMVARFKRRAP